MRIGFIGASGLMGHGMARNLLAKGHELVITVHRNRERVGDLLAAGAAEAADPAALAAECEVVLLCVTGSPQVEAVMLDARGVLAGARAGLVVVDTSTSEPASTEVLRGRAAAAGVTFVDAPLARTPVEAEAGRLNVMVGAEPAVFERLQPVLRCFAENVFHVGGPGAGHVIKLLNNFIAQSICTATAEAFAVGQRAGIDPRKLVELVGAGPVNNGLFQAMAKTLGGQMDGLKFELDNARKDVRYYTHLAEGLGIPTVVGEAVHQSLALASALGHGRKFVPSLVEAQEQLAGVKLVPR
ncbi:MAG: NAD(P)-dependent oxidoreductase [Pseudomonadota bacterium]|jgi:3-hydroxyisobutyrate dehydrogenase-like beta-hydroxyacid dehydrogenase|nr:NAD(P)-dependent oxidoreductase [Rubrivivax sp.]MCA3257779.1 NAD(P)-dependent oxidoreductase [Rubrivivax sp.]MCE2912853.1 NAD(P)-dependent oxidoreductase [Rubrivivax sp.]MCZ8030597.1 NAD(P)-dependent oxidoreductase [Rubrivivax sp.]